MNGRHYKVEVNVAFDKMSTLIELEHLLRKQGLNESPLALGAMHSKRTFDLANCLVDHLCSDCDSGLRVLMEDEKPGQMFFSVESCSSWNG